MMQNDQQLTDIKTKIHDIFVEVDSEVQQAEKKAANMRNLEARRAIEDHFERKKLEEVLIDYRFDE